MLSPLLDGGRRVHPHLVVRGERVDEVGVGSWGYDLDGVFVDDPYALDEIRILARGISNLWVQHAIPIELNHFSIEGCTIMERHALSKAKGISHRIGRHCP